MWKKIEKFIQWAAIIALAVYEAVIKIIESNPNP